MPCFFRGLESFKMWRIETMFTMAMIHIRPNTVKFQGYLSAMKQVDKIIM